MEEKQLTDRFFFDTDCLSAFLWVHGESILAQLYSGRVILPAQVYDELKRVPHLLARVDAMRRNSDLIIGSMEVGSTEYHDYLRMITAPDPGMRIIGKGEAACIAMVKERGGTIASNNLKDVSAYVEKYGLEHITTGDILMKALNTGIISETDGNDIWADMIRRRRMLPAATFTDYMETRAR